MAKIYYLQVEKIIDMKTILPRSHSELIGVAQSQKTV
jgi:hypothetical protein